MHRHTYHIAPIAYNILHVAHNILHITHNIFHIIHSYALRPLIHGLIIQTSHKWGLNTWDHNQGAYFSKHRVCFIHSYVLHFILLMGQRKHQLYLGCSLRLSSGSLCNYQEWPNLITLTCLVSFVSLCASLEACLIHSWGTLTWIDFLLQGS